MEICTCNPRKHGEFFVLGRLICIYCRKPVEDADKISDLEAQTIAQARTIEQQSVIIREHQAADVIAVEAIRAQAAEIAQLKSLLDFAQGLLNALT